MRGRSDIFSTILYKVGKFLCWLFFLIFCPLRVHNASNIPKKGKFILASNHASFLDPPLVGVACPRDLNFMARDNLFRNPLIGWVLRNVHAIALKRNTSDVSALKTGLKKLEQGKGLLLFPEGTRSINGEIGEGLAGVGFLARKGEAPVIVVFVKGTDQALPKGAKFVKRHRVDVFFGKPMIFKKSDTRSDKDITQAIMNGIKELQHGV